jgi:hypothetical protein
MFIQNSKNFNFLCEFDYYGQCLCFEVKKNTLKKKVLHLTDDVIVHKKKLNILKVNNYLIIFKQDFNIKYIRYVKYT